MDAIKLKQLMQQVAQGELSPDQAVGRFKMLPYEDLGFARVDHHRRLRKVIVSA